MKHSRLIVISVLIAILTGGLFLWLRPGRPVNILLITLDTTRADRLGCYGYDAAETPHLDSLAARGVLFERAYAPIPMTLPSHASMLTGLWPPEHGLITNGQNALDPSIPTAATLLTAHGYSTAAFIAGIVLHSKLGLNQGFHVYDDDLSNSVAGVDELHRYRDGRFVIDSALKWLKSWHERADQQPFFCWVHLYDPHDPYLNHPDEFGTRFAGQPYDAEIAYTDRQVGRLLEALAQMGINDRTCVVVVGDHGESLGEHGEETHGFMLHESTLRVPLIIAHPQSHAARQRVTVPVPLVDLFPTLLEVAGVHVPNNVSGQSLQRAIIGEALTHRVCYSQTEQPYLEASWCPLRSLTTDRWRYVRTTQPELYDLAADPRELSNLAESQPEVIRDLERKLSEFESHLRRRTGIGVTMSAQERRALESLGYTGGQTPSQSAPKDRPLPDIKEMIPHLNRLTRATHLMEEREYNEAAEILEPLVSDVPNYARAWQHLGLCRLKQKNFDAAVESFQRALAIDPSSDRTHDMLGFAYLRLGKLDSAAKHFVELLTLRPDSENGHLFLGEIEQRKGNIPLAFRHYEAVLRLNPENAAARQAIKLITTRHN